MKVLLIDDSIFTLHHYCELVTKMGHEVRTAESGEEAIHLYTGFKPEIILCDLMMPEMDGFEVLEELQKIGLKAVFYFMTADIQEHTRKRALQLGAKGLISKPVPEETLRKVLSGGS